MLYFFFLEFLFFMIFCVYFFYDTKSSFIGFILTVLNLFFLSLFNSYLGLHYYFTFIFFLIGVAYAYLIYMYMLPVVYIYLVSFFFIFECLGFADNLLVIFILLEILNYLVYMFIFNRKTYLTSISLVQFFCINSLISIVLLFGLCYIYLHSGTMNLENIVLLVSEVELSNLSSVLSLGLFIWVTAFLAKLGMVPFIFWYLEIGSRLDIFSFIFFSVFPKIFYLTAMYKIIFAFLPLIVVVDAWFYFFLFFGCFNLVIAYLLSIVLSNFKGVLLVSAVALNSFFLFIILLCCTSASFSQISYIFNLYLVYNVLFSFTFYLLLVYLNVDLLRVTSFTNLYKINKNFSFIFLLSFFFYGGFPLGLAFLIKIFISYIYSQFLNFFLIFFIFFIICWSSFFYLRFVNYFLINASFNRTFLSVRYSVTTLFCLLQFFSFSIILYDLALFLL